MGLCFLCDTKLFGERTRVCSSITPHSNVPYPEKVAELLGDEFVIICTPADHMCKKCTSLLTHLDKLENDLKLVKNAMLSYIQKKYGLLSPDQPIRDVEFVNGHLRTDEPIEHELKKLSSGSMVREAASVTTTAIVTPIQTPIKMLKTIHQQQKPPQQKHQQQQQQQHHQQKQQPQDGGNKMKIYKCGFCTFQSKELGHVRFHMRTHTNKKEPEKPIVNHPVVKAPTTPLISPQKRRLYRCQVCSKSFDSRINCLDHIQKDHNQPTASTSNGGKETDDRPVPSKTAKLESSKSQENNLQEESSMAEDENPQDNNTGTVDTDLMLNDNVSHPEVIADTDQDKETKNAGEDETMEISQDDKTDVPESVQEEANDEEKEDEVAGIPKEDENNLETSEAVEMEVETANVENKTGDLDIESMLAAIHNDNPPTSSDDTPDKD